MIKVIKLLRQHATDISGLLHSLKRWTISRLCTVTDWPIPFAFNWSDQQILLPPTNPSP